MRKTITFLLFVFINFSCFAHTSEKERDKIAAEETPTQESNKKRKNRLIGSPILFYTPETSLAFGGAGSYIFRMAGCKKNTRPSSISPLVIYTLETQFKAQLVTEFYFKNNNYHLNADIKLKKYPNKFFGIGSNTREEDEEVFTSKSTNFLVSFLKKISKSFNIGLKYHFSNWKITETEEGGIIVEDELTGSQGGTISGISFLVNRDTRDNIYFPMKGELFELNAMVYKEFLGSDFDFTDLTLDLRKYFTFFSSHVFAVQSLLKIQSGTVPFMNLSKIGGEFNMRGYFEGRFRDKNLLVLQAEYRLPLFWRFGLVGFAGFGNVAEKFSELKPGKLKSSYGLGLRFLFDKKEKIRIRMDIGFGKDSTGFYFSIFEAF